MKRFLMIFMAISCAWSMRAQEVVDYSLDTGAVADVEGETLLRPAVAPWNPAVAPWNLVRERERDTLSLPPLTYRGTIAHVPSYGSFFAGYSDWALHQGLNASLSASAIFGLGHNAGSGFANSLSLMYADSLTPKLSFALGGYTSFLEYGGRQMKDAGLTAMLSYRFNDHWEAAVFAQKSVVQPRIPPQLYWMSEDAGDKIGASLRYNFNPGFSVSVSVWEGRRL